jgi:hypothetical protein
MGEGYTDQLSQRNFVCEVTVNGTLLTVLYIDKRFCTVDSAKEEFRAEAKRMKEQLEEGAEMRIKMRL